MDESISVSSIIDKLPPSWKDFKHTLKHGEDDLSLVQLSSHLRIEDSLRAQDSDKGKCKEVDGPSMNMTEEGKNKNNKQNKGKKRGFKENNSGSSSNKKPKLECWKCGKTVHFKRDCRSGNKKNANVGGSGKGLMQLRGGLIPVLQLMFVKIVVGLRHMNRWKKSVLYMGDDHFASVHGKGSNLISGPVLNKCGYKQVYKSDKYILSKSGVFVGFGYYNNGHVHYKRMLEMSKDDLIPAIDEFLEKCTTCMLTKITRFCYVYLLHAKDEALDKFRIYKIEVKLQQNDLIKTLCTDRGGEYYDPVFFQSVRIIHETTAPYTLQKNGVAERKNRALKEMVNSMVPNKRNKTIPYELWYKKRPSLSFLQVWGCRAVVRLPDSKRKTLGEKGIDCIFVGYAEHSKAYRFYVIEPNDSVSINSIIESRDAIFDKNRFSSIPRPKDIIPNSVESQRDDHYDDVPNKTPKPRKVGSEYSYCYSIEEDPRTYNEAMQSRDAAFLKEAIDDEIGSIMENNTWALSDLPPGCKPLGCKWIFKRKMKVDGTINKFKARLVIQGFRQKEGIDYFDTYAPVARITTIRLLLALAAIHNLVIHQMDVKTTFLNGDLDEEMYMKQPEGFVMPVDKTKKFLSSRFSMKDMGEAEVILGIKIKLENKGIEITQSHYIEKILLDMVS
ncbi:zinc finger, CCHC-type containing protein [Tanacetum coccineum]